MLLIWLVLVAATLLGWLVLVSKWNKSRLNLPPRPFAVPLLGCIGLLIPRKNKQNQHKALFDLSSSYGGIFRTTIGCKTTYIVTSYRLFREAVIDKPMEFIGRPDDFIRILNTNPHRLGLGVGDGSPAFMAYRKFMLVKLRSLGFGQRSMEFCILAECEAMLNEIDKRNAVSKSAWNLRDVLCTATANVIFSVLCGKHYEYDDPQVTALTRTSTEYIQDVTDATILLAFPVLTWITPFAGRVQKHVAYLHTYINELIQERLASGLPTTEDDARDFMDIYLIQRRQQLESGEAETFSVEMLVYTIEDLFLGGFETTATTIQWLVLVMLHFPNLKRRIQCEIDEHCRTRSKTELITLADTGSLMLTVATIWEVWRLFPILPFGINHRALENAKLGGYDVEKDKDIVFHLWSMHHDPQHWHEPEKFFPERFLAIQNDDGNIRLEHPDELVVFSAGRRSCMGEQLARKELFLLFANIMRTFDVELRQGTKLPQLEGKPGFIMYPPEYEATFIRRESAVFFSAVTMSTSDAVRLVVRDV